MSGERERERKDAACVIQNPRRLPCRQTTTVYYTTSLTSYLTRWARSLSPWISGLCSLWAFGLCKILLLFDREVCVNPSLCRGLIPTQASSEACHLGYLCPKLSPCRVKMIKRKSVFTLDVIQELQIMTRQRARHEIRALLYFASVSMTQEQFFLQMLLFPLF